jgi:hypothetical protein
LGGIARAVRRHRLALPAAVLQTAAEEMVEFGDVLRPDHIAIALDEHHRHLRFVSVARPIIGRSM